MAAIVAVCLAAGCGGSTTAPSVTMGSVEIATGTQMLRLTYQSLCGAINGAAPFPLVYTRVNVSRTGDEWIAAATSAASGDVELRFHQSGQSVIAGAMPVEGIIRNVAIHLPEMALGVPVWNSRMNFGNDGRTTITGIAGGPSALMPGGGINGIGSGTVTLSDDTGRSCGGGTSSSFSWTLALP